MIQNFCYISVAERYIKKRKRACLFLKIALVLLSGALTLYMAQKMTQKCLSWVAGQHSCACQWITQFGSDLVLNMEMQNIGTEPWNPVYWISDVSLTLVYVVCAQSFIFYFSYNSHKTQNLSSSPWDLQPWQSRAPCLREQNRALLFEVFACSGWDSPWIIHLADFYPFNCSIIDHRLKILQRTNYFKWFVNYYGYILPTDCEDCYEYSKLFSMSCINHVGFRRLILKQTVWPELHFDNWHNCVATQYDIAVNKLNYLA